jgi:integrase
MRERSPGHWELRAFVGRDALTDRPRQVTRTFVGGERAAAKALGALVADVEAGKFAFTRATVGQLLDKWLETTEAKCRPKTAAEYRSKVEHRIRPALGAVPLHKLGPHDLDAWYRQWLQEGLSPSTVHHLHAVLSAALNQAVKWGWIDRAPTTRASPPPLRQAPMKVPTPEQLNQLHRAAAEDDEVLATAIGLAALTGARRGELVALRWSDVDLVVGRVSIARSLSVVQGVVHEGPTKTHQARDVALDEIGVGVLRDRWATMRELAEEAGSPLVGDPFVLSYNANGAVPVGPDTITHGFTRLCIRMEKPALEELRKTNPKATRADLAPADRWPFRFHDLRHFSVTTLIAAGVDVRTVADRHGHARATMTLDRYAHALPERDRAAAGVLGSALNLG